MVVVAESVAVGVEDVGVVVVEVEVVVVVSDSRRVVAGANAVVKLCVLFPRGHCMVAHARVSES